LSLRIDFIYFWPRTNSNPRTYSKGIYFSWSSLASS